MFLEAQKYIYIFFQMVIFATLFRHCPTLWKSTLKMTTLFRRCLTLFNSLLKTQRCFNVVKRCKFWRWLTQRWFNVHLTLCDVATSHQPKNNVGSTLKCLLGCAYTFRGNLYLTKIHKNSFFFNMTSQQEM